MAEQRESSNDSLKVKIEVECAEALKGLKAVTREAKKATAALKELEEQQKKVEFVVPLNLDGKAVAKVLHENLNPELLRKDDSITCIDCGEKISKNHPIFMHECKGKS
ncbi:hypothetical protein [Bacillus sp. B-jedd]|uniref:hypothetical protein n=1 Tax=Bacillus sp. B-jedd TaxID=1476857 RepID=UPI0005156F47|nr:hypothetical protein [Bacillus sp. B-jedd]CEG25998.1 hypothetical protein BN1002_00836 [Bacillus sp. B-jedd]